LINTNEIRTLIAIKRTEACIQHTYEPEICEIVHHYTIKCSWKSCFTNQFMSINIAAISSL